MPSPRRKKHCSALTITNGTRAVVRSDRRSNPDNPYSHLTSLGRRSVGQRTNFRPVVMPDGRQTVFVVQLCAAEGWA